MFKALHLKKEQNTNYQYYRLTNIQYMFYFLGQMVARWKREAPFARGASLLFVALVGPFVLWAWLIRQMALAIRDEWREAFDDVEVLLSFLLIGPLVLSFPVAPVAFFLFVFAYTLLRRPSGVTDDLYYERLHLIFGPRALIMM